MGKICENTLKLFNVFFCLVVLIIIKFAVFDSNSVFQKLNIFKLIFSIILFICFLILIMKLFQRLSKNTLKIISLISLFIIIVFQIFFWKNFKVNPSWDFGVVFSAAEKFASGKTVLGDYFYNFYPNNIGIAIIWGYLFKVLSLMGISNYLDFSILINIIMVDITIVVIYLFIDKLHGNIISAVCSVLMIFITPLYTYTTIVYTDTLSMIFPIAIFFIYYNYYEKNRKNVNISMISIGVLIGVGVIVKTNVIIALVALIIYIIFTVKDIKKIVKMLLLMLIPFILVGNLYKVVEQKHIPIPLEKAGFPATHWVMMGLTNNGGYNPADVNFTSSITGKENKEKANIEMIKERLKNYGVSGYLKFIDKKLSYTWSDGTLYAPEKLRREPIENNKYQKYIIGNDRNLYLYVSQTSYTTLLILALITVIFLFKNKSDINYLFNISIFGVFLFLIIWETRSRYILCFLPVIILSASSGLNYMNKNIFKNRNI